MGNRFAISVALVRWVGWELLISQTDATVEVIIGANGYRCRESYSSTGGSVVLGSGRRRIDVSVEWLTGKVSVADAH